VHARKKDDADLYLRRVRNLIGASECIFGLVDAYPHPYEHFFPRTLRGPGETDHRLALEASGFTHRWPRCTGISIPGISWCAARGRTGISRCSTAAGANGANRPTTWPTMSINYLLFGLYEKPRLAGDFERLYLTFWETYLRESGDDEMLSVIAPFYVFRGLVIASPQWYPNHPLPVRRGLLRFLENVLEDDRFDCLNINRYME
jgi:hypothetical protein